MFYIYKRTMLIIRAEGEDSETLNFVWRFGSYNSIFFPAQFIINTFFLCNLFAFGVFCVCYLISSSLFRNFMFDYLKSRPPGFWIGLVPVILG